MAPGFFRKLFTKMKDFGKKAIDFGKKVIPKIIDVVPKIAPAIAPIADQIIPGSGAAIRGLSGGLEAIQPIFKNKSKGGGFSALHGIDKERLDKMMSTRVGK